MLLLLVLHVHRHLLLLLLLLHAVHVVHDHLLGAGGDLLLVHGLLGRVLRLLQVHLLVLHDAGCSLRLGRLAVLGQVRLARRLALRGARDRDGGLRGRARQLRLGGTGHAEAGTAPVVLGRMVAT